VTDQDAHADRITRLEEALLFAERRVDELHEEVLGLGGKLERVAGRLAALERHALVQSPEADGGSDTGGGAASDPAAPA
jgi:hypothetical protein